MPASGHLVQSYLALLEPRLCKWDTLMIQEVLLIEIQSIPAILSYPEPVHILPLPVVLPASRLPSKVKAFYRTLDTLL